MSAAALFFCAALASAALAASIDFDAGPAEPAGDGPTSVAAADLDGDGDQDLAVADFESDDVTILRNDGAGDFSQATTRPEHAIYDPIFIAAADLDGDGDRDLAVANFGSQFRPSGVTILLNSGRGRFSQAATSPEAAGYDPISIAAADLDGDGDRDLAVANYFGSDVTILLNNGVGNFSQPATSPEGAGRAPADIAAADLDGDGDRDLAVANQASDDVTILRNHGDGNFKQRATSPEAAGDGPLSIIAADLDGDGDQDLAVPDTYRNRVTILKNSGSGDFFQRAPSPEAVGADPHGAAAADLDDDGDQDLAVANISSHDVTILRNNGAGNFGQPTTSPEEVGRGPNSIAAADLDGDGDQDLAVANAWSDNVTILRNR